jgi:hypothetical protein
MQYGTVKVPRSVLIQHAKFFLIIRIRVDVESTGVWLRKLKQQRKKQNMTLVSVDLKFMYIMMC